jgi:hypothetical protein
LSKDLEILRRSAGPLRKPRLRNESRIIASAMRTIAELLRAHAGEQAWIFGKGPSLDRFDVVSCFPWNWKVASIGLA